MITHDLIQGSPEWLAYRAQHFNASDAPAMMGCSPYKTRAELLRELHTGVAAEVDPATQRRFDDGHRAEALARPLAEGIIGQGLYPVTGSLGNLSASFDGITLAETECFEHKRMNDAIRAAFDAMDRMGPHDDAAACRLLPVYHRVQMEQQLYVSDAERVLFMASRWTDDGELIEQRHCWYYPDAELRAQIIAGWAQFESDLCAYVPPVIAEPARAETMESLPAVAVRLDGALTVAGNLPTFAKALRAFIDRMPKQPATDNDFATTDAACKALKKAEEALDAAEQGALASITDVEAMRRAVADCRKLARDTRLAAEKMVERRKVEIKEQAVAAARRALDEHIAALNAELAPMTIRVDRVDFAAAIKGLRSFTSMQDALDTAVAGGKIAADGYARIVRANVAAFKAATGDDRALQALFADLGQLVHKAGDDFAAVVDQRITKHRADEAAKEAKRQAEEDERIAKATAAAAEQARREEEARQQALQREAAAAAAAAAAQASKESTEGRDSQQVLKAEPATADATAREIPAKSSPGVGPMGVGQPADAGPTGGTVARLQPAANDPATLNLGAINALLDADGGLVLRGEFITKVLKVPAADRSPRGIAMWRESQVPQIVTALHNHLSRVMAQMDQKAA